MSESTSLGRALHKGKSINVEANILDEWQHERNLAMDRIRFRAGVLTACLGTALILTPLAISFQENSRAAERKAETERALLESKLKAVEESGKDALPIIAYDQLVEKEQISAHAMLGNLILIFNSAPNKVAISRIKAAVTGGEISIQLSADSEDSESAKAFASDAGKGPGVVYTVLASTKKSTVLGPDGLGFDIDKKVVVGK